LGIPRGTLYSKYTQLFVSFLTTAVCHHLGAYMITRTSGGQYTLWISQFAVIVAEDAVLELGKRYGVKDSRESMRHQDSHFISLTLTDIAYLRAFGKAWVILWLSLPFTLNVGTTLVMEAGAATDPPPFGFSVSDLIPISAACGGNWWKIAVDRGLWYLLLSDALYLLDTKTIAGALTATRSGALASALWFTNKM
jgi:hypothetical protein